MTRKGFTLIELIIVVAIIGILAAIAIPKFVEVRDKAKIATYYDEQIALHSFNKSELIQKKVYALALYEKDFGRIGQKVTDYTIDLKFQADINGAPPALPGSLYRLQDGNEVNCTQMVTGNAGTDLTDCTDGKAYLSQTNVTKLN